MLFLGIFTKLIGAVVGGMVLGLDGQSTKLLASVIPGRLSISVAAAGIWLNRGLIDPNLSNSFIVLAIISVFLSSRLFRCFSEKQRQQNTTTDIIWTLPRSQER